MSFSYRFFVVFEHSNANKHYTVMQINIKMKRNVEKKMQNMSSIVKILIS
jgi:hypothetical protein